MKLTEEIKKIQKLIVELSSNSHGVAEFLDFVGERPEILNHLNFTSIEDLKEYVMDATIKEFDELRKEVEEFVNNRKKYLNSEIEEFVRVSEYLKQDENIDVSPEKLINLFQQAKEVEIPKQVWSRLENTECPLIKKGDMKNVESLSKKYGKEDPKKLKSALQRGDYDRPLILNFGNRYHLVAGNTRLCTAAAVGVTPKVIIAKLDN